MDIDEMVALDLAADALDYGSSELLVALSKANKTLSQMRDEIEKLKGLSEEAGSKIDINKDYKSDLDAFTYIIPSSVRKRVKAFADSLEGEERLLSTLCQETYSLLLYDEIVSEVGGKHDLSNPVLSNVVRSTIDNSGKIPKKTDMNLFLKVQPKLLDDIEDAYQKHATPSES